MGTLKDVAVIDNGPMVLKVPTDLAQLTSKKNSNLTSEANESSKSNHGPKLALQLKSEPDEQVIDDNSGEEGD